MTVLRQHKEVFFDLVNGGVNGTTTIVLVLVEQVGNVDGRIEEGGRVGGCCRAEKHT